MAGPTRFELATSGVTGRRSNQLNYDPAVVWFGKIILPQGGVPPLVTLNPRAARITFGSCDNAPAQLGPASRWPGLARLEKMVG